MSAEGVADAIVAAIAANEHDLIVANFANPDMVGHTGVWKATIAAVEAVDAALGRIVAALEGLETRDLAPGTAGWLLAITADHGNADAMRDAAGNPVTAHSLNPVPLLLAGRAVEHRRLRDGVLADVAPTLLELAGLPPWRGVTGGWLLVRAAAGDREPSDPVLSSGAVSTGGPPQ
jgi:2,3-bisphosphoglycerate-independent phosphoglycerate mutase